MCGRYNIAGPVSLSRAQKKVLDSWDRPIADLLDQREPQYNVAPTQKAPVIAVGKQDITVEAMKWGLVPAWSKDGKAGYNTINAKVETFRTSRLYKPAFEKRRCIVPATGYFEWKGTAPHKQPYNIVAEDRTLLAFAGLWDIWRDHGDESAPPMLTFTIIVGPAGLVAEDIHDRQPIMLPPDTWEGWLTGDPVDASDIIDSVPVPALTYYPVPKAVGNPRNKGPELIEEVSL